MVILKEFMQNLMRVSPLLLIIIFLIFFVATKAEKKVDKCHNLGGVYINGQCFKAEIIEIN